MEEVGTAVGMIRPPGAASVVGHPDVEADVDADCRIGGWVNVKGGERGAVVGAGGDGGENIGIVGWRFVAWRRRETRVLWGRARSWVRRCSEGGVS